MDEGWGQTNKNIKRIVFYSPDTTGNIQIARSVSDSWQIEKSAKFKYCFQQMCRCSIDDKEVAVTNWHNYVDD